MLASAADRSGWAGGARRVTERPATRRAWRPARVSPAKRSVSAGLVRRPRTERQMPAACSYRSILGAARTAARACAAGASIARRRTQTRLPGKLTLGCPAVKLTLGCPAVCRRDDSRTEFAPQRSSALCGFAFPSWCRPDDSCKDFPKQLGRSHEHDAQGCAHGPAQVTTLFTEVEDQTRQRLTEQQSFSVSDKLHPRRVGHIPCYPQP